MSNKTIQTKYNTQEKCIAYLEKLRWNGNISCAYCGSAKTIPLKSEPRHHCYDCKNNFSVTIGTIFEHSRYPLPDWFQMIWLVLNAKQGISASQLHRTLECSYKTAWYVAMRLRCAMIDDCIELQNIVEMDEAYVGGKPRKRTPKNVPSLSTITTIVKRGRGTSKTPIVGIVERKGRVVLKVMEKINGKNLTEMLKDSINEANTIVITDEYKPYKSFDEFIQHLTIDHSKEYSKGIVHTNTIEGFWSIIKNSIRGQYIVLSRKYLPLYLVQAQYIYNRRDSQGDLFEEYLKRALTDEKCMVNYKPLISVDKMVYKPKVEKKC